MRRAWAAALVLAAALSGCGGPPETRAILTATDVEEFGHCPPITAKRLARYEVAFSGVLTIGGPDGVNWVFEVDHWYTGGDEDVIVVRGNDVSISYFESTVESEDAGVPGESADDGDRFLVAGMGMSEPDPGARGSVGSASACLTEPWTEELASLFDKAFPTPSPRPTPR